MKTLNYEFESIQLIQQGYFFKKELKPTKKYIIREEWYNPITKQNTYILITYAEAKGE